MGSIAEVRSEEVKTIEHDLMFLESIKEKLKVNSNYALMFVDNKFLIVDTTDNKFDIVEELENDK